jgi:L-lysine 2,3-aminomutase
MQSSVEASMRYRAVGIRQIPTLPHWQRLAGDVREGVEVLSQVLPFRTNRYVLDLVDWDDAPDDPIFQLTFPQRGMLAPDEFRSIADLLAAGADAKTIRKAADTIRLRMNPHPAGQITHNVPRLDGEPVEGLQHKYRETVLYFPAQGQTCHAYCTYCFRWPQFVGLEGLRFASREAEGLVKYLKKHPEVNSVLITGGDPLVMRTSVLRRYIEPLLVPEL